LFGLLLLVGSGIIWMLRPAGAVDTPTPDVAAAGPERPEAPPGPGGAPSGSDPELPEAIRRYLAATPYPKNSGLLNDSQTDLLEPNRRPNGPCPSRTP